MPISSISMGRGPVLRPPWSGGPSMTTLWPLPDSATNWRPSVHFTVAFMSRVSLSFAGYVAGAVPGAPGGVLLTQR